MRASMSGLPCATASDEGVQPKATCQSRSTSHDLDLQGRQASDHCWHSSSPMGKQGGTHD